jgi:hypothetical protein
LQQTQDAWLTAAGRVPRSLLGGDRTAADANIEVTVESSPIALGFVSGLTDMSATCKALFRRTSA